MKKINIDDYIIIAPPTLSNQNYIELHKVQDITNNNILTERIYRLSKNERNFKFHSKPSSENIKVSLHPIDLDDIITNLGNITMNEIMDLYPEYFI